MHYAVVFKKGRQGDAESLALNFGDAAAFWE